nr:DUF3363 domain-containing protein [Bradyrhizobium ivorense]
MSTRTDLEDLDANVGDKISGVYRRMPTLNSGRFALIEQSRECVLVPDGRCWSEREDNGRGQVGREGISCRSTSSAAWMIMKDSLPFGARRGKKTTDVGCLDQDGTGGVSW